jgi:hypothetical protein
MLHPFAKALTMYPRLCPRLFGLPMLLQLQYTHLTAGWVLAQGAALEAAHFHHWIPLPLTAQRCRRCSFLL